MAWKSWFIPKKVEEKATEIHRAIVRYMGLEARFSERNYENFAKEGYKMNVWVFACIQAISSGVASVPWNLYGKKANGERTEILNHEILKIINKPNERTSRSEFFESFAAFMQIAGNAYIDMNGPNEDGSGKPTELWVLRPDRIKVLPDENDFVRGYEYQVGGQKIVLPLERVSHLRLFNPLDDFYGMSPIEAAARGVDNNNSANEWNNALLANSARPGGALISEQALTERQYNTLKENLDKNHSGAANAGRPLLLEGGLKWQEMSLNPRDMDFIASKKMTTVEICAAFRVPPEIVGHSETKTYSNYQEARKALYEDAILPALDKIRDKLNADFVSKFGDNLELDYDKDSIEALQENRDAVYKRAGEAYKSGLISQNEGRNELGYGDIAGGEKFFEPKPMLPTNEDPKAEPNGKKSRFF